LNEREKMDKKNPKWLEKIFDEIERRVNDKLFAFEHDYKFVLNDELKKVNRKLPKYAKHRVWVERREDGVHLLGETRVPKRPWKFVLWGTRPHIICARLFMRCGKPDPLWKHASAVLVFVHNGILRFARKVSHPGVNKVNINELRKRIKRRLMYRWKRKLRQG